MTKTKCLYIIFSDFYFGLDSPHSVTSTEGQPNHIEVYIFIPGFLALTKVQGHYSIRHAKVFVFVFVFLSFFFSALVQTMYECYTETAIPR